MVPYEAHLQVTEQGITEDKAVDIAIAPEEEDEICDDVKEPADEKNKNVERETDDNAPNLSPLVISICSAQRFNVWVNCIDKSSDTNESRSGQHPQELILNKVTISKFFLPASRATPLSDLLMESLPDLDLRELNTFQNMLA